ncbi:unnamed protein product [Linum tenue]|uniref:Uncharacterized protein n=1 Tax=Linum tenue TaxID=586396 RepID=A0AAV0K3V0_9ROSI|nr:unnamed protein product [Linum tenue]CAI0416949.1 unnamed protein product [Linum tenue]
MSSADQVIILYSPALSVFPESLSSSSRPEISFNGVLNTPVTAEDLVPLGMGKVQAKLPHLDPRLADPAVYQVLKELLSDYTTKQFLELQMSIHLHKLLGSILE